MSLINKSPLELMKLWFVIFFPVSHLFAVFLKRGKTLTEMVSDCFGFYFLVLAKELWKLSLPCTVRLWYSNNYWSIRNTVVQMGIENVNKKHTCSIKALERCGFILGETSIQFQLYFKAKNLCSAHKVLPFSWKYRRMVPSTVGKSCFVHV